MERTGYAVVSLDDVSLTVDGSGDQHSALTDRLGCADTDVDVYLTRADARVSLSSGSERLCVPIDGVGTLTVSEARAVRQSSIVIVPAGTRATIESGGEVTWIVVSAAADPTPGANPVVVHPGQFDFAVPTTSDVLTARLTDRLGCRGMKVNVRRLQPGDVVPYHTEGTQEELFVPLDGPGRVRVGGETHTIPQGSITRVAPELPRSAVNPGEEAVLWLMIGAPPTGGPDEWDPGAEIHEWPRPD